MRFLSNKSLQYNCSRQAERYGGFFIPVMGQIYLQVPCGAIQQILAINPQTNASVVLFYDWVSGTISSGLDITNVSFDIQQIPWKCFYLEIKCKSVSGYNYLYTEQYENVEIGNIGESGYYNFNCNNYVQLKSEYPCYDSEGDNNGLWYDNFYQMIPLQSGGTNPYLTFDNAMLVEGDVTFDRVQTSNTYEGDVNFHTKSVKTNIFKFRSKKQVPEWYARMVANVIAGNVLTFDTYIMRMFEQTMQKDPKTCLFSISIDLENRKNITYFACQSSCM